MNDSGKTSSFTTIYLAPNDFDKFVEAHRSNVKTQPEYTDEAPIQSTRYFWLGPYTVIACLEEAA